MADNADAGGDAQVSFKVKTSGDRMHTITMAASSTVLDLKNKLATEEYENIPTDRQRLIYSGRVLKNDDTLGSYKIKAGNTIHLVKSAASNPAQTSSTSAPTPQAVPTNMASGTANNPLSNLTGARYAGHQINLPGLDMFGPDGGMGPPMDEERLTRMMEDPNVQQTMNEALNNDDFINMLIQSNPMLRNMPNAREIITSPFMRQMMSNPSMMSQAMRMQRNVRSGGSPFPAPGATDSTPGADSTAPTGQDATRQEHMQADLLSLMRAMRPDMQGSMAPPSSSPFMQGGAPNSSSTEPRAEGQEQTAGERPQPPANPFQALFNAPGQDPNMGGMDGAALQEFMRMMGGGGAAAPPQPADNRPPEERYEMQLRQLNDMGFFDFDRNVTALRRSGGNVQGAIDYLLNSID